MGMIWDLLKKAVQDGKVFVNGGIVEEPITLESIGSDKKASKEDRMIALGLAKRREKAEKRCEASLVENVKSDKKLSDNTEGKEVKEKRKREITRERVESIKTKQPNKSRSEKESKGIEISD